MKYKEFKKNLKTEYKNTIDNKKIKSKFHFSFKWRYAFIALAGIILLALVIEHIYVLDYNKKVRNFNSNLTSEVIDVNSSNTLTGISSREEYNAILNRYVKTRTYRDERTSIFMYLFEVFPRSCSSKSQIRYPASSPTSGDTSYQTNVQVEGIEEADVAKCDGENIYYLTYDFLKVYSIKEEKEVCSATDYGKELFIYKNKIISFSHNKVKIYEFENNQLSVIFEKKYTSYLLSSRLIDNTLYYVFEDWIKGDEEIQYGNCYYDDFSRPNYLYDLYKINLDTMEMKSVQSLSCSYTHLYVSKNHLFLSSLDKNCTSISIFDMSLNPVGVVHLDGKILNQFSMDEYDSYFRVVTTDTRRPDEEINAITIFDLSDGVKKVGCLNQGIGIGSQTVHSVRFEKNICYVVTYQNQDPLYEIDCSNPEDPRIVSAYEAPGYSSYLHTFHRNDKKYVLGLGFLDFSSGLKISLYENKEEGTTQIGKDYVLTYHKDFLPSDYLDFYINKDLIYYIFGNHKALFIYDGDTYFYLGVQVSRDEYLVFCIDVSNEDKPIYIHLNIPLEYSQNDTTRAYLVDGVLYVVNENDVTRAKFN
ncbi:MAG: beta-propeller domain-containing protein [Anaeroplasmataceae bacterium]|nr:beta-propeller domain-containing protein [Anaeroplasmataceae bacterium]